MEPIRPAADRARGWLLALAAGAVLWALIVWVALSVWGGLLERPFVEVPPQQSFDQTAPAGAP